MEGFNRGTPYLLIRKRGALMFKYILKAVLFISIITSAHAGTEPARLSLACREDISLEVVKVVKGAVEDTSWLHASSRQEMEYLLTAYYTGSLLDELSDSGWRFVSRQNSWEYVTSTGRLDFEVISEQECTVCVEVLEEDEITGLVYSSIFRYNLIKKSGGWRIRARTACMQ